MAEWSPRPPRAPPALSVPSEPLSQAPLPDPGAPDATLRVPSGLPAASPAAAAPRRVAFPAPSFPCSRFRFRSALGTTPPQARLPRCRVPSLSGPRPRPPRRPGPRSPGALYSPPTRYMLAAMAVPAAASGRTKGSGRLAGAGLGSRRSPERGADASRKSRSSPRSRHLHRLSRRGSSRPALSPPPLPPHAWDAEASAGPLGLFRNELGSRRTGARLRLPPPALAEPHQTLGSAGRREGLPCPPRGSPPSGTPSADPENKARRSAQVGERDPTDRLLPEEIRLPPANRGPALGYFRCSSAPPPRAGEELGLTHS